MSAKELLLHSKIRPTEFTGNVGELSARSRERRSPTQDDVLGPFYRPGAPYRAKVSPYGANGTPLLINGRVWGFDSKKSLPAHLDIWQADASGKYDNQNPQKKPTGYSFRTRTVTDEHGAYEFESIHPGSYRLDDGTWRAPHIHFIVSAYGYITLVTQLFFEGDEHLDTDPFVKKSLIIRLHTRSSIQHGVFDIVLARPET